MFSDLNKVTQKIPTARDPRAQQTDTREEIRRHDPDQERKKGSHKGFAEEQGLFGDDQTEVSVQSLEAFLPMLLKNYGGDTINSAVDKVNAPGKYDHSNPNAKAAGAYARMAQYGPAQEYAEVESHEDTDPKLEEDHPTLSKQEIQTIHRLQTDVKKLRARGVQVVYINKAGTFLESLQNGVSAALQAN